MYAVGEYEGGFSYQSLLVRGDSQVVEVRKYQMLLLTRLESEFLHWHSLPYSLVRSVRRFGSLVRSAVVVVIAMVVPVMVGQEASSRRRSPCYSSS